MLIDWFTVIAQIVNFLILVGLLKYFLFDRITKAMDEREQTIASALEKADETWKSAAEEAERYRLLNEELEETRRHILDDARNEADSLRRELFQQARAEIGEAKAAWEESLEREKGAFLVDLRKLVGEQALSISRAALSDLANSDLEDRIVHAFVDRLRDLSEEDTGEMRNALESSNPQLTVQTAFDLSEKNRNEILESLRSRFNGNYEIRWSTAGSAICGVELRFSGHKLAWSIDSYLDGLEKTVASTLEERVHQITGRSSEAQYQDLTQKDEPQSPGGEQPTAARGDVVEKSRGEK